MTRAKPGEGIITAVSVEEPSAAASLRSLDLTLLPDWHRRMIAWLDLARCLIIGLVQAMDFLAVEALVTAGASGFLLLTQSGERPDVYRESFRIETTGVVSMA